MKIGVRSLIILTLCVVLSVVIFHLTAVMLEGEQGRLKRTIHKAKRLAERENVIGLTNYISIDYSDDLGNDRRTLLFIAKRLFDEYKNILILIDSLETEIAGKDARALLEATVYWQDNDSGAITYDRIKCIALFTKTDKRWLLVELKFSEPEERRIFNPNVG
ncbi:MAG: hypothetical protein JW800_07905 [Candidatus Omnitrophica bacterium]|nr:hypothetical protein [Candidatus Omnitrophota bacterium]